MSQHVRQGTVSPTHYVIVSDTSSLKIDHIQQITYRMTHMYYNWPGTVRVPAPCQVGYILSCVYTFVLKSLRHVEQKDDNDWIKRCMTWEVEGIRKDARKRPGGIV